MRNPKPDPCLEDSSLCGVIKRTWPAILWFALFIVVVYCWSHTGVSC